MYGVYFNNMKKNNVVNSKTNLFLVSGQDGKVGKCCTHLLPQPHQNYN